MQDGAVPRVDNDVEDVEIRNIANVTDGGKQMYIVKLRDLAATATQFPQHNFTNGLLLSRANTGSG